MQQTLLHSLGGVEARRRPQTWDPPANLFKSTKVLMATSVTPQGRSLGYQTPEQVSNPEPRFNLLMYCGFEDIRVIQIYL